ncbi:uncharacterized protein LOC144615113 isoform X2 [Panthera onca]
MVPSPSVTLVVTLAREGALTSHTSSTVTRVRLATPCVQNQSRGHSSFQGSKEMQPYHVPGGERREMPAGSLMTTREDWYPSKVGVFEALPLTCCMTLAPNTPSNGLCLLLPTPPEPEVASCNSSCQLNLGMPPL